MKRVLVIPQPVTHLSLIAVVHKPGCMLPHERKKQECQSGGGGNGNGNGSDNGSSNGNGNGSGKSASGASSASSGSGTETSSSSGSNGVMGTSMSRMTMWLMIVAAAAAAAALIAAVVGQRRNRQERHQLSGSVGRRMKLFTNLADGNLCGDRPARVVEMNNAKDYQMA